jgi:hypothetical protein
MSHEIEARISIVLRAVARLGVAGGPAGVR